MIDKLYKDLGIKIIRDGNIRLCRNGKTISLFGQQFKYNITKFGFPILSLRRIYPVGIVGEFRCFIENHCSSVQDFKDYGCNYWDLWANSKGQLILDYSPKKQLDYVIKLIKTDPTSRRILINLWNLDNQNKLSLSPCHTQYQFYVREKKYLDMIWTQRSADFAIGLPSDIILAALYLIYISQKTNLNPGEIIFNFGDLHIYLEHIKSIKELIFYRTIDSYYIDYKFENWNLELYNYKPLAPLKFCLKK